MPLTRTPDELIVATIVRTRAPNYREDETKNHIFLATSVLRVRVMDLTLIEDREEIPRMYRTRLSAISLVAAGAALGYVAARIDSRVSRSAFAASPSDGRRSAGGAERRLFGKA